MLLLLQPSLGVRILGLLITSPLPGISCTSSFFGTRHLPQPVECSGYWDSAKPRVSEVPSYAGRVAAHPWPGGTYGSEDPAFKANSGVA